MFVLFVGALEFPLNIGVVYGIFDLFVGSVDLCDRFVASPLDLFRSFDGCLFSSLDCWTPFEMLDLSRVFWFIHRKCRSV